MYSNLAYTVIHLSIKYGKMKILMHQTFHLFFTEHLCHDNMYGLKMQYKTHIFLPMVVETFILLNCSVYFFTV